MFITHHRVARYSGDNACLKRMAAMRGDFPTQCFLARALRGSLWMRRGWNFRIIM